MTIPTSFRFRPLTEETKASLAGPPIMVGFRADPVLMARLERLKEHINFVLDVKYRERNAKPRVLKGGCIELSMMLWCSKMEAQFEKDWRDTSGIIDP